MPAIPVARSGRRRPDNSADQDQRDERNSIAARRGAECRFNHMRSLVGLSQRILYQPVA
jgi:hypothetical protein